VTGFRPTPTGRPRPRTHNLTEEQAAIRQVTVDAGFTRFRRAAETPFNLVYEVRP
jgi:hypothetical protein